MSRFCHFFVVLIFLINSTNVLSQSQEKGKVLFVVSNQTTYGNSSIKTANHFGEIVFAYDVFLKNNFSVDFVSPKGGAIPIGYINISNHIHKKYSSDASLLYQLKNTKSPNEITTTYYKAIYYVGGGAAMFGVPENEAIQKIALEIYNNNGLLSAVCHGTAGIVNIKKTNGNYIFQGKKVTGFPDKFENKNKKYYQTFPFSIEEIINKRGGKFSYSDRGWDNYYTVDGRIITGQDPTASASLAKEIIKKLNQL